jgi:hypothetical protein
MRRIRCAAAAVLLGFAPSPRAASAEPPSAQTKVANDPYPDAFRDKVKAAVARGVQTLRGAQRADGSWSGFHHKDYPAGEAALATLALIKSGVRVEDPAVERAFAYVRKHHVPRRTYETGLVLLAVAAKYDLAGDDPAADEGAAPSAPLLDTITASDRDLLKRGVDFLEKSRVTGARAPGAPQGAGLWGYPGGVPAFGGVPFVRSDFAGELWADVSNAQYAIFGLRAAARCGIPVSEATWLGALHQLLAWQSPKGPSTTLRGNEVRGRTRIEWTERSKARGFGYTAQDDNDGVHGSMTAAGTAALMICADALGDSAAFTKDRRAATREAIRDGLAWMQANFTVARNPGRGKGEESKYFLLYYYYGLERLGGLSRARFFGSHDWYLAGAQALLEKQRSDGAWGDGGVLAPVDTCFALLFLGRSTTKLAHPVITPDPEAPPPGK